MPGCALHRLAAEHYAGIDAYTVQLCRREQVNGQDKPEELVLFKFRKQPYSVYMKWLGPTAKGREVVFVEGRHKGEIHTLLASGDMLFQPAGKQISMAPDNFLVRSASRHAITEAGFGVLIGHFGKLVEQLEKSKLGPAPPPPAPSTGASSNAPNSRHRWRWSSRPSPRAPSRNCRAAGAACGASTRPAIYRF